MSEWIEHDGMGVPPDVAVGVKIRVKYRNGREDGGTITPEMLVGPKCVFNGVRGLNPWFWAVSGRRNPQGDLIAYRIMDDGAEAKRRASRKAMFDNMAKEALKDGIRKAPQKERV